jgi:hypothetical protein
MFKTKIINVSSYASINSSGISELFIALKDSCYLNMDFFLSLKLQEKEISASFCSKPIKVSLK